MTTFADISHHQATVDMAAYAAAGHDRIILKATEGVGYVDPAFADRWRAAGSAGLRRVAYHYARNANNGADEFDHFLAAVRAAGLAADDWLCLDTEDTDTPTRAVGEAGEFTNRAAALGYPNGLVYTGRWYARPNGLLASVFAPGWRRLWLSHYDTTVPDGQILLPDGWTRDQLVARQYSSTATVAGISGGCDYSRLLIEWLTPTTPEVFMTLSATEEQEILRAARQVNGAVAPGQASYSTTVEATLTTVQSLVNIVRSGDSALAARLADTQTAVLGAVAALPTDHLSDEERQQLAADIAGKVPGVDQAAVLDALAARLAA